MYSRRRLQHEQQNAVSSVDPLNFDVKRARERERESFIAAAIHRTPAATSFFSRRRGTARRNQTNNNGQEKEKKERKSKNSPREKRKASEQARNNNRAKAHCESLQSRMEVGPISNWRNKNKSDLLLRERVGCPPGTDRCDIRLARWKERRNEKKKNKQERRTKRSRTSPAGAPHRNRVHFF